MPTVSDRAKFITGLLAIIGLVVLLSLMTASVALGAFHLEYAPGVERSDGMRVTRVQELPVGSRRASVSVQVAPRPLRAQAAPQRSSGGCYAEPGTPPHSIMMRESGGDPRVWNGGEHYKLPGHSTASGCWGFIQGTWNNYKGYRNAADAPVHIQNEKAKQTWAGGAGCSHWAAC